MYIPCAKSTTSVTFKYPVPNNSPHIFSSFFSTQLGTKIIRFPRKNRVFYSSGLHVNRKKIVSRLESWGMQVEYLCRYHAKNPLVPVVFSIHLGVV